MTNMNDNISDSESAEEPIEETLHDEVESTDFEAEHGIDDDDEIDRREAIKALTKYSAAGGAAMVVLSSKQALSMGFLSDNCVPPNPPPFCP